MLRRVTFGLEGAWIVAIVGGFGAGLGYLLTLRLMTEEPVLFFSFVRGVGAERIRLRVPPDCAVSSGVASRCAPDPHPPAQAMPPPG